MKFRKVVLDTNVLISALVFGGKPRRVFQAATAGVIQLVISEILLEELTGVLEGAKFRYPKELTRMILDELTAVAELVTPTLSIRRITSDPDDNRVLECALAGRADLIVSGDPHLLDLVEFEGIPIWTPAKFVKELQKD